MFGDSFWGRAFFHEEYWPGASAAVVSVPGTALLRFVPAHGALLRILPAAKEEA